MFCRAMRQPKRRVTQRTEVWLSVTDAVLVMAGVGLVCLPFASVAADRAMPKPQIKAPKDFLLGAPAILFYISGVVLFVLGAGWL